jgi:methyl-coenzyme M reductase alpha subunit
MKITFADPSLKFDFAEPRREFARGAIREFMPAGERSLIIPAK